MKKKNFLIKITNKKIFKYIKNLKIYYLFNKEIYFLYFLFTLKQIKVKLQILFQLSNINKNY